MLPTPKAHQKRSLSVGNYRASPDVAQVEPLIGMVLSVAHDVASL